MKPSDDIDALLEERGNTHGDFWDQADATQALKGVIEAGNNWDLLVPDQCEALHMICNKIGRILNGDPDFIDHWDDIAGYAKLVANRIRVDNAIIDDASPAPDDEEQMEMAREIMEDDRNLLHELGNPESKEEEVNAVRLHT